MEIVWTPRALATREAQIDYVAEESPQAALDLDMRIEEQIDQLADYPELGRAGRKRGTRELVISRTPYIAVYRVQPRAKRVEVLLVLHGSQLWPLVKLIT